MVTARSEFVPAVLFSCRGTTLTSQYYFRQRVTIPFATCWPQHEKTGLRTCFYDVPRNWFKGGGCGITGGEKIFKPSWPLGILIILPFLQQTQKPASLELSTVFS